MAMLAAVVSGLPSDAAVCIGWSGFSAHIIVTLCLVAAGVSMSVTAGTGE